MPDAKTLTRIILKKFIGSKFDINQFDNLRPEVVFQRIAEYEENKLLSALSVILESYNFNQNHLLLALLLQEKVNIITTNFDTLIEKAATYLNIRFSCTVNIKEKKPTIFKVHGSIDEKSSLKYIINHVHLGLPKWKNDFLFDLVKGKTVLVLGYSGLDELDIMPALNASQYKEIIWINHKESNRFYKNLPQQKWIKQLKNLIHINSNTDSLVASLIRELTNNDKKLRITPYHSEIIYMELLEHQNKYEQLIKVAEKSKFKNNIRVKIFHLIAQGSLSNRKKNYDVSKEQLLTTLFKKTDKIQKHILTFIGDAANTPERWKIVEQVFDKELLSNNCSYYLVEAILGYIAWIAHQNKITKGKFYLKKVYQIIIKKGYLLLEARCIIAKAQLLKKEIEKGVINLDKIKMLNLELDRAIFLMSNEIFNDEFFFYKAYNFKAMTLIELKKIKEAKKLLRKSIKYFTGRSVNNLIDAYDIYARAELKEKNLVSCLSYLNKGINQNLKTNRSYYLGNLLRKKAIILEKKQPDKALILLNESANVFSKLFLYSELRFTNSLIKKLAK